MRAVVGAFPRYSKHDAIDDFKGMMAFNGDSARFTEQSAWLPLAFNSKTRVRSREIGNVADSLLAGGEWAERRVQYIAHEMGHYYFGTLNQPQGPYYWFLLESSAEFLSIKALREVSGDAAADRYVARLQSSIDKQDKPLPALDTIDASSNLGELYRYVYAPLLLLSLEQQVGEAKMQAFMRGLLAAPSPNDWAELQTIAMKAGIDAKAWEQWQASCVSGGAPRCRSTPRVDAPPQRPITSSAQPVAAPLPAPTLGSAR